MNTSEQQQQVAQTARVQVATKAQRVVMALDLARRGMLPLSKLAPLRWAVASAGSNSGTAEALAPAVGVICGGGPIPCVEVAGRARRHPRRPGRAVLVAVGV